MFACILFVFSVTACEQQTDNEDLQEVSMKEYYSKEDFQSIVIGESTYQDVYNIVPLESIQVTSYGGMCEYPMQDGGCIRIKFYGKELIVGMIEVDLPTIKND